MEKHDTTDRCARVEEKRGHALTNLPHVSQFTKQHQTGKPRFEFDVKARCEQPESDGVCVHACPVDVHQFESPSDAWQGLEAYHSGQQTLHEIAKQYGQSEGRTRSEAQFSGAERPREAGAKLDSLLLEVNRKDCDAVNESTQTRQCVHEEVTYEAQAQRCKCGFCGHCCTSWGIKTRMRLIPIVETFTEVQMWTLTIDPTLFESPQKAFEYLKEKRCVARLIRRLRKLGVLHSKRFFAVIEWHKSGYAHFHVLLDSTFIEKKTVQRIWDSFRPAWAGPKPKDRPGFGFVGFTKRKGFASKCHAARYATKYLMKSPHDGYPEWVLDYRGQVHRYSISHGFWSNKECSEADPSSQAEESQVQKRLKPKAVIAPRVMKATIRERLDQCANQTILLARHFRRFEDGTTEHVKEFLGVLNNVSYRDAKSICGFKDFDLSKIPLSYDTLTKLRNQEVRRRLETRFTKLTGGSVATETN